VEVRHLARQVVPCVLRRVVIGALREIRHICHDELLDSSSSIERLFEVLQASSPEGSQMLFSDPRAEPEIEFLYLVGDSVLVRLGGPDAWVSTPPQSAIPILDYLDRIGVNVSSSVPLVVATHAHDDQSLVCRNIFRPAASAFC
jgi:hypothetical protein